MPHRRDATPSDVRRHAMSMLTSGKATLPEMAGLLGVSTQTIWNWCRLEKVDWRKARLAVVAKEWSKISR